MVRSRNTVGGKYYDFGGKRLYVLTVAVTANSTVVSGARAGDLITTTHATGKSSIFVADGASKAQFLTNS
jgi:hypothetical protein